VKCAFCGTEFDEETAVHACRSCTFFGTGCKRVKCPNCGYEMAAEPGFVRRLREWWRGRRERRS